MEIDLTQQYMLKFHLWSRRFVAGISAISSSVILHYIRFLNAFIRTGLGTVSKFAKFVLCLLYAF